MNEILKLYCLREKRALKQYKHITQYLFFKSTLFKRNNKVSF